MFKTSPKQWFAKPKNLRRTNDLLSVVAIFLALYIIASPYLPAISWWAKHEAPVISRAPEKTITVIEDEVLPENTLVIPKLGMQEKLHQGDTEAVLREGVWVRPQGTTPDKLSNTVLSGHRFTYSGQAVFYHLDKVNVGDEMQVHWEGALYEYTVTEIKVVPPTAIEIEYPTETPRLTVYTCTPLWSAKDRLVIIAEPTEES